MESLNGEKVIADLIYFLHEGYGENAADLSQKLVELLYRLELALGETAYSQFVDPKNFPFRDDIVDIRREMVTRTVWREWSPDPQKADPENQISGLIRQIYGNYRYAGKTFWRSRGVFKPEIIDWIIYSDRSPFGGVYSSAEDSYIAQETAHEMYILLEGYTFLYPLLHSMDPDAIAIQFGIQPNLLKNLAIEELESWLAKGQTLYAWSTTFCGRVRNYLNSCLSQRKPYNYSIPTPEEQYQLFRRYGVSLQTLVSFIYQLPDREAFFILRHLGLLNYPREPEQNLTEWLVYKGISQRLYYASIKRAFEKLEEMFRQNETIAENRSMSSLIDSLRNYTIERDSNGRAAQTRSRNLIRLLETSPKLSSLTEAERKLVAILREEWEKNQAIMGLQSVASWLGLTYPAATNLVNNLLRGWKNGYRFATREQRIPEGPRSRAIRWYLENCDRDQGKFMEMQFLYLPPDQRKLFLALVQTDEEDYYLSDGHINAQTGIQLSTKQIGDMLNIMLKRLEGYPLLSIHGELQKYVLTVREGTKTALAASVLLEHLSDGGTFEHGVFALLAKQNRLSESTFQRVFSECKRGTGNP
ncbi:hypothetical protein H6764_02995 [Candidatus Nomurabacteria bacterium]|nr:hypothetical protein [Candidatus Nomurabacteria bacterium]